MILAFDLYLRVGPVGDEHPDVQALSAFLRSLPIHPVELRAGSFRNPNGVARKLADIPTHQPGYAGEPTNGSRLDTEVWTTYGNDPDRARVLAAAIHSGLSLAAISEADEEDFDSVHREGRIVYRIHRQRERSPRLRRAKMAKVQRDFGRLQCEACGLVLEEMYGVDHCDVYECHHLVALHLAGEVAVTVNDVALVCPTCHRVAHRLNPLPTLEELQRIARHAEAQVGEEDPGTESFCS